MEIDSILGKFIPKVQVVTTDVITTRSDVVLLVGTVKGLFLFHGDKSRESWRLTGPHFAGHEVFSVAGDDQGRLLIGTDEWESGPTIRISEDLGESWQAVDLPPKFPQDSDAKLNHIWQIVPAHPDHPGTWYAGVDDAALFVSRDDGKSWHELTGLTNHPTRSRWTPGFGGLCLHSIVVDPHDPNRLWVGISSVGIFRSTDAGETWQLCNEGLPNVAPDFIKDADMGRCVHKLALDPNKPGALVLQYHFGVYRSEDGADSWTKISAGLPHDFGFPLAVTAHDLFVVPLLADNNRIVPEGALKVWRSRDRGRSWRALSEGLPQQDVYVGVLRDAMAADSFTPSGIYFGTSGGEVYISRDDGEHWISLPARLPRITTVKVWCR